jgi:hypothetical protein
MIKKNKIEQAKETYMEAMLGLDISTGTNEVSVFQKEYLRYLISKMKG